MKCKIYLFAYAVAALLCSACTTHENLNGVPSVDDPALSQSRPQPSTPCGDTTWFSLAEANGNYYVDDCGLIPCVSNTIPWGDVRIMTFKSDGDTYLGLEGIAASGWVFTDYDIFVSPTQYPTFGPVGTPVVDGNWLLGEITGHESGFREEIQIQPAGFITYNISIRASLYRLDFWGSYDSSTFRELWISRQPNSNNNRRKHVIRYSPPSCNAIGNRVAFQN